MNFSDALTATKMNKWISVKERVPVDTKKYVLVFTHGESLKCRIGQFDNWDNIEGMLGITHWMELPEAP